MLPAYNDIRSRIAEDPVWYDGAGVPRYEPFRPEMLGVYDDFALLAEIECASCGTTFLAGNGWPRLDLRSVLRDPSALPVARTLRSLVSTFDYGDPPRHDYGTMGRCAGETMCSNLVRIVEAWESIDAGWVRHSEFERMPSDRACCIHLTQECAGSRRTSE